MHFDNLRNEFVLLGVKVSSLVLLITLVNHKYPYDLLQPYGFSSTWDYIQFGLTMGILFWAYLDTLKGLGRMIFRRVGRNQLKSRLRFFYWLRDALQIQSAANATELRRQAHLHWVRCGQLGVIGVANRETDGSVTWSPNMARHAELIWVARRVYRKTEASLCEQGFLDHNGNFLTREEAYHVAEQYKQIIDYESSPGERLYSESLF